MLEPIEEHVSLVVVDSDALYVLGLESIEASWMSSDDRQRSRPFREMSGDGRQHAGAADHECM